MAEARQAGKPSPYCCACGSRKPGLQRCSGCRAAYFCDRDCQAAVYAPAHKATCEALRAGRIPAVLAKDVCRATQLELQPDDSRLRRGVLSPILAACGIPLRLARVNPAPSPRAPPNAALDNQLATARALCDRSATPCADARRAPQYAMIDPRSGFAPPEWQCNIGECLFFRDDGLPLTHAHLALIWDYLCSLVDEYGDEAPAAVNHRRATPAAFQAHVAAEIERHAAPDEEDEEDDVEKKAERRRAKLSCGVGAAF